MIYHACIRISSDDIVGVTLKLFDICYLWDTPADRTSPFVSPTFADSASFPPSVTLISASEDLLMKETQVLADRLQKQPGVDVVYYMAKGQGHAWDKHTKVGTDSEQTRDEAYNLVADRLKKALWA